MPRARESAAGRDRWIVGMCCVGGGKNMDRDPRLGLIKPIVPGTPTMY